MISKTITESRGGHDVKPDYVKTGCQNRSRHLAIDHIKPKESKHHRQP